MARVRRLCRVDALATPMQRAHVAAGGAGGAGGAARARGHDTSSDAVILWLGRRVVASVAGPGYLGGAASTSDGGTRRLSERRAEELWKSMVAESGGPALQAFVASPRWRCLFVCALPDASGLTATLGAAPTALERHASARVLCFRKISRPPPPPPPPGRTVNGEDPAPGVGGVDGWGGALTVDNVAARVAFTDLPGNATLAMGAFATSLAPEVVSGATASAHMPPEVAASLAMHVAHLQADMDDALSASRGRAVFTPPRIPEVNTAGGHGSAHAHAGGERSASVAVWSRVLRRLATEEPRPNVPSQHKAVESVGWRNELYRGLLSRPTAGSTASTASDDACTPRGAGTNQMEALPIGSQPLNGPFCVLRDLVEQWGRKHSRLSFAVSRVESPEISRIVDSLSESSAAVYAEDFRRAVECARKALVEAKSNTAVLLPVAESARALAHLPSADFPSCLPTIRSILHTVYLCWGRSDHFNQPARISSALAAVACDVVAAGHAYANLSDAFDDHAELCAGRLDDVCWVSSQLREMLLSYNERVQKHTEELRRPRHRCFAAACDSLGHFEARCSRMAHAIRCAAALRTLDNVQFGGRRGAELRRMFQRACHDAVQHFSKLRALHERGTVLVNPSDASAGDEVESFIAAVPKWERRLSSLLHRAAMDTAFLSRVDPTHGISNRRLSGPPHGTSLVSLRRLVDMLLPSMTRGMIGKTPNSQGVALLGTELLSMIKAATEEVESVRHEFNRTQLAPQGATPSSDTFPRFPPVAAKVAWAQSLQSRVRAAEGALASLSRELFDTAGVSSEMDAARDLAAEVTANLEKFVHATVEKWVTTTSDGGLAHVSDSILLRKDVSAILGSDSKDSSGVDVSAAFHRADTDGSGTIELDEFKRLLVALGVPLNGRALHSTFAEVCAIQVKDDGVEETKSQHKSVHFTGDDMHSAAAVRPAYSERARVDSGHDREQGICLGQFTTWWNSDFHRVRRVFQVVDSDGSGEIDIFEFATLLQNLQIHFAADQFASTVRQLAHAREDEPEAEISVDFHSFFAWWSDFSANSGTRLVSVNYHASLESVIREVRYLTPLLKAGADELQDLIPATLLSTFEIQREMRQHLAALDHLVSAYNGVHVTMLPDERPLFTTELAAADDVLHPGFSTVTWSSPHDIEEFLEYAKPAVTSLADRLAALKRHVQQCRTRFEAWRRQPVFAFTQRQVEGGDDSAATSKNRTSEGEEKGTEDTTQYSDVVTTRSNRETAVRAEELMDVAAEDGIADCQIVSLLDVRTTKRNIALLRSRIKRDCRHILSEVKAAGVALLRLYSMQPTGSRRTGSGTLRHAVINASTQASRKKLHTRWHTFICGLDTQIGHELVSVVTDAIGGLATKLHVGWDYSLQAAQALAKARARAATELLHMGPEGPSSLGNEEEASPALPALEDAPVWLNPRDALRFGLSEALPYSVSSSGRSGDGHSSYEDLAAVRLVDEAELNPLLLVEGYLAKGDGVACRPAPSSRHTGPSAKRLVAGTIEALFSLGSFVPSVAAGKIDFSHHRSLASHAVALALRQHVECLVELSAETMEAYIVDRYRPLQDIWREDISSKLRSLSTRGGQDVADTAKPRTSGQTAMDIEAFESLAKHEPELRKILDFAAEPIAPDIPAIRQLQRQMAEYHLHLSSCPRNPHVGVLHFDVRPLHEGLTNVLLNWENGIRSRLMQYVEDSVNSVNRFLKSACDRLEHETAARDSRPTAGMPEAMRRVAAHGGVVDDSADSTMVLLHGIRARKLLWMSRLATVDVCLSLLQPLISSDKLRELHGAVAASSNSWVDAEAAADAARASMARVIQHRRDIILTDEAVFCSSVSRIAVDQSQRMPKSLDVPSHVAYLVLDELHSRIGSMQLEATRLTGKLLLFETTPPDSSTAARATLQACSAELVLVKKTWDIASYVGSTLNRIHPLQWIEVTHMSTAAGGSHTLQFSVTSSGAVDEMDDFSEAEEEVAVLDTEEEEEAVRSAVALLDSLPRQCRIWSMVGALNERLQDMLRLLPLIAELQGSNLQPRHWNWLAQRLGVDAKEDRSRGSAVLLGTTVEDLIRIHLPRFSSVVSSVCDSARRDHGVRKTLDEIVSFWESRALNLHPFSLNPTEDSSEGDTAADAGAGADAIVQLLSVDPVVSENLEDHQVVLRALNNAMSSALGATDAPEDDADGEETAEQASAHLGKQVLEWSAQLNEIEQLLELWHGVQKSWMRSCRLFMGTGRSTSELRTRFPNDAELFDLVHSDFVALQRGAEKWQLVVVACAQPGLAEHLVELQHMLDACHASLEAFLESKRVMFPRFYFMSAGDLLDMLSRGHNAPAVTTAYLYKMFDSVTRLRFAYADEASKSKLSTLRRVQTEHAVKGAEVGELTPVAVAMVGACGEEVMFQSLPATLHADGESRGAGAGIICGSATEEWLGQVEERMRDTIYWHLLDVMASVPVREMSIDPTAQTARSKDGSSPEKSGGSQDRDIAEWRNWLLAPPTQVSILASEVLWTRRMVKAFRAVSHGSSTAFAAVQGHQYEQLSQLLRMIREQTEPNQRVRLMSLATLCVRRRDVLDWLLSCGVRRVDDFAWASQLRVTWEPGGGVPSRSTSDRRVSSPLRTAGEADTATWICGIHCYDASVEYAYEFVGTRQRLVVTPLTQRVFITLLQAFKLRMGGAPAGPAGTGKTETVKDLGHSVGRAVFVFNCSEQMDVATVGSVFKGLAATGTWGCLDEFNRIAVDVLSVVAQQFRCVSDAMRSLLPPAISSTVTLYQSAYHFGNRGGGPVTPAEAGFTFTGEASPTALHAAGAGVFITMNPGYAGRTELPQTVKALFRPVAMVTPDLEYIAENMLLAEGFATSKVLAKKVLCLFQACSQKLPGRRHYDWGMRAVKQVLSVAGLQRRTSAGATSDSDSDARTEAVEVLRPNGGEAFLLRSALLAVLLPKLLPDDIPPLVGSTNALFTELPPLSVDSATNPEMLNGIAGNVKHGVDGVPWTSPLPGQRSAQACGLDGNKLFSSVVWHLHTSMCFRHSVFLIGAPQSGKTSAWAILAAASAKRGEPVRFERLCVNALSIEEVYGSFRKSLGSATVDSDNASTGEWQDGLLTTLLRSMSESSRGGQKWLILDGVLDPHWTESLNSVMDDNKILTLASNERVALSPDVRLVFEALDLSNATPATVSRGAVCHVSSDTVTWKSILLHWITLHRLSHRRTLLVKIATKIVPASMTALDSLLHHGAKRRLDSAWFGCRISWFRAALRLFEAVVQTEDLANCLGLAKAASGTMTSCSSSDEEAEAAETSATPQELGTELLFCWAVVWGLGGHLDSGERARFDNMLRRLIDLPFPDELSVFDYAILPERSARGTRSGSGRAEAGGDSRVTRTVEIGDTCLNIVNWDTAIAHSAFGLGLAWVRSPATPGAEQVETTPPPPSLGRFFLPAAHTAPVTFWLSRMSMNRLGQRQGTGLPAQSPTQGGRRSHASVAGATQVALAAAAAYDVAAGSGDGPGGPCNMLVSGPACSGKSVLVKTVLSAVHAVSAAFATSKRAAGEKPIWKLNDVARCLATIAEQNGVHTGLVEATSHATTQLGRSVRIAAETDRGIQHPQWAQPACVTCPDAQFDSCSRGLTGVSRFATLIMHGAATVPRLRDSITGVLERSGGKALVPPGSGSDCITLFIDDLHLAAKDDFGTCPIHEFIRSAVDVGGWYDPQKRTSLNVERLGLFAAVSIIDAQQHGHLGAGHGNRLAAKFTTLRLKLADDTELRTLFSAIVEPVVRSSLVKHAAADLMSAETALKDAARVQLINASLDTAERLVHASTSMLRRMKKEVPATPIVPHYVWGMSHIANSVEGMLRHISASSTLTSSPLQLCRLWRHETTRAFGDGLATKADLQRFDALLDEVTSECLLRGESQVPHDGRNSRAPVRSKLRRPPNRLRDGSSIDHHESAKRWRPRPLPSRAGPAPLSAAHQDFEHIDTEPDSWDDLNPSEATLGSIWWPVLNDDLDDRDDDTACESSVTSNMHMDSGEVQGGLSTVHDVLSKYQEKMTMPSGYAAGKVVLFETATEHILRLIRILSLPTHTAMFVGVGGMGKRSLVRLAAFITNFQLVTVRTPTNTAGQNDPGATLTEQYRTVLLIAGLRGERVIWFANLDAGIGDNSLGFLSTVVSSVDPWSIMADEDREAIHRAMRRVAMFEGVDDPDGHRPSEPSGVQRGSVAVPDANGLGDAEPRYGSTWRMFLSRVRSNLRVVISASPSRGQLSHLTEQYPQLVRRSVLSYFFPWSSQALGAVAQVMLSSIDLDAPLAAAGAAAARAPGTSTRLHRRRMSTEGERPLPGSRHADKHDDTGLSVPTVSASGSGDVGASAADSRTKLAFLVVAHRTYASVVQEAATNGTEVKLIERLPSELMDDDDSSADAEAGGCRGEEAKPSRALQPFKLQSSPAQFIDLCLRFELMFEISGRNVIESIKRLARGQGILARATETVGALRLEVQTLEANVERAVAGAAAQRQHLAAESDSVDREAERAKLEETECERIQASVAELEVEAAADLSKAEPVLRAAERALGGLDKPSLTELKSFVKPHQDVRLVMSAVYRLLAGMMPGVPASAAVVGDARDPDSLLVEWKTVRPVMARVDHFLGVLRSFKTHIDELAVPSVNVDAVRPYLEITSFERASVEAKSRAAGGICHWVRNIVKYRDIFTDVHPRRMRLADVRAKLTSAEKSLLATRSRVTELQEELKHLTEAFAAATEAKNVAQRHAEELRQRLELASRVVNALQGEGSRWEWESQRLRRQAATIVEDTMLRAAFTTYAGGLASELRDYLVYKLWIPYMRHISPVSWWPGKYDHLGSLLASERQRSAWIAQGLPSDDVSEQNAAVMESIAFSTIEDTVPLPRWVLMVDPQEQGVAFLRGKFRSGAVTALELRRVIVGEEDPESRQPSMANDGTELGHSRAPQQKGDAPTSSAEQRPASPGGGSLLRRRRERVAVRKRSRSISNLLSIGTGLDDLEREATEDHELYSGLASSPIIAPATGPFWPDESDDGDAGGRFQLTRNASRRASLTIGVVPNRPLEEAPPTEFPRRRLSGEGEAAEAEEKPLGRTMQLLQARKERGSSFSSRDSALTTTDAEIAAQHSPERAVRLRSLVKDDSSTGGSGGCADMEERGWLPRVAAAAREGHALLLESAAESIPVELAALLNASRPSTRRTTAGHNDRGQAHRRTVRIGTQDVALHPRFRLFFATTARSPTIPLAQQTNACVINFSITPVALTEQLLSRAVAAAQPVIDQRHREVRVSVVEYKELLREAEDGLLEKLASATGDIISDEPLVNALEHSRTTAQEIAQQMAATDLASQQISETRLRYRALASQAAELFALCRSFSRIHPLYQFSLRRFLAEFDAVLALWVSGLARDMSASGVDARSDAVDVAHPVRHLDGERPTSARSAVVGHVHKLSATVASSASTAQSREQGKASSGPLHVAEVHQLLEPSSEQIEKLWAEIKLSVYCNMLRGLFDRHQLLFVFGVAVLTMREERDPEILRAEIAWLQRSQDNSSHEGIGPARLLRGTPVSKDSPFTWISQSAWQKLQSMSSVPSATTIVDDVIASPGRWRAWVESASPENETLPGDWSKRPSTALLMVLAALRPDRLAPGIAHIAPSTLGDRFAITSPTVSLGCSVSAALSAASPGTPVLFIISEGSNPIEEVESEAKDHGFGPVVVSLGQGQYVIAEEHIRRSSRRGEWLILQNIHLAPTWLPTLARIVAELGRATIQLGDEEGGEDRSLSRLHKDFRLILTAEPTPDGHPAVLPEALTSACSRICCEPPVGLRANLRAALELLNGKPGQVLSANGDKDSVVDDSGADGDGASAMSDATDDADPAGGLGHVWTRSAFVLCWYHSVLSTRCRLGEHAMSKVYPFGSSDLSISLEVLRASLGGADGRGRVSHTYESVWQGLRYIFGDVLYGGHISDKWDRRISQTYLKELFEPRMLDADAFLLSPPSVPYRFRGIAMPPPAKSTTAALQGTAGRVPNDNPLALRLHANAAAQKLSLVGASVLHNVRLLDVATSDHQAGSSERDDSLLKFISRLIVSIPRTITVPREVEAAGRRFDDGDRLLRSVKMRDRAASRVAADEATAAGGADDGGLLEYDLDSSEVRARTHAMMRRHKARRHRRDGDSAADKAAAAVLEEARQRESATRRTAGSIRGVARAIGQVRSLAQRVRSRVKARTDHQTASVRHDAAYRLTLRNEIHAVNTVSTVARESLEAIAAALEQGTAASTGAYAADIESLHLRRTPQSWLDAEFVVSGRREYSRAPPLAAWVQKLTSRAAALEVWCKSVTSTKAIPPLLWLAGLYRPQAFVTAMREVVAAAHGWPLDEAHVAITITPAPSPLSDGSSGAAGGASPEGPGAEAVTKALSHVPPMLDPLEGAADGVHVCGLQLEGARWDASDGCLGDVLPNALPEQLPVALLTARRTSAAKAHGSAFTHTPSNVVEVPVYATSRQLDSFLFSVRLPMASKDEHAKWVLSGTAILLASEN